MLSELQITYCLFEVPSYVHNCSFLALPDLSLEIVQKSRSEGLATVSME